jgi:MoCo/4Fe-4S cofactor protein with predicted Tat translocation signal
MSNQKKYWKGIEELNNTLEFNKLKENEFSEEIPVEGNKQNNSGTNRRDFLKFLGFSVTAASLASCEAPIRRTIPYLIKPEEITLGVANWYASNYYDGYDYCDVIIKTREGRPIKIEGNKLSEITKGGVNARVQASVLSLYDSSRLKAPVNEKKEINWDEADKSIISKLNSISAFGGNIRVLSSTIISPSTKQIIADFTSKFPTTKHITYDAVSYSGIIQANANTHGKPVVPTYNFDKAQVIVSFGADFLINWLSPIEFSAQYASSRKLNDNIKVMSKHIQYETALSVSGSNADVRVPIKPSQNGSAILNLYNELATKAGRTSLKSQKTDADDSIKKTATELWSNKGKSLVISNSNDVNIQIIINEINSILNNYENVIDINTPLYLKQGNDAELGLLIEEMKVGKVNALIVYNSNPVYTLPASIGFTEALKKVDLKISLNDKLDETGELMTFVCPDNHFLESWNDANPKKGYYALSQPSISPLFKTRAAQESLMKWAGIEGNYHDYIQKYWEQTLFSNQSVYLAFTDFWNHSLQNGVVKIDSQVEQKTLPNTNSKSTVVAAAVLPTVNVDLNTASEAIIKNASSAGVFEFVVYEKTGMGIGIQANNPWLQELPDPISKVTWDNYLAMSPTQMKEMGLNVNTGQEELADVVDLNVNGVSLKVPVLAQPGQMYGTVSLAVGYGRTAAGKAANNVGVNAFQLIGYSNNAFEYSSINAQIGGSIGKHNLAATQTHHTMMGREIVKETSLAEYIKNPSSGNPPVTITLKEGEKIMQKKVKDVDLWESYDSSGGSFWNMSIDLNSCIGCGACVVSCQAENNIPVVGKDQVNRGREMHWMRIDRYYSSDTKKGDYQKMEIPSENPEVVFQPIMCQHCNHAPCETVCPVIATCHSLDGLNQMAYNRCVGTRYCANNCPYKVRRFNWYNYSENNEFDFNMNDDLAKMVLNPDVVVRSRGVMEKCSLCVQRIQEGKLKAKMAGVPLKEGDIQTACSQSCPTNAISFGDKNNSESEVVKLRKQERSYLLLEEVGIQPNVFYLTKVRNAEKSESEIN